MRDALGVFHHSYGATSIVTKIEHPWWYDVFTISDEQGIRHYLTGPYGDLHRLSEEDAALFIQGLACPVFRWDNVGGRPWY